MNGYSGSAGSGRTCYALAQRFSQDTSRATPALATLRGNAKLLAQVSHIAGLATLNSSADLTTGDIFA